MDDRAAAVAAFMMRLAGRLRPAFPQYAGALMDQIQGRKMTNERWNRIAAILASLAALPGRFLGRQEHDARNPALAAVIVAQKMAAATFGGRNDVESCLDLAAFMAGEIEREFETGTNA